MDPMISLTISDKSDVIEFKTDYSRHASIIELDIRLNYNSKKVQLHSEKYFTTCKRKFEKMFISNHSLIFYNKYLCYV